jgi:hypothetical protein
MPERNKAYESVLALMLGVLLLARFHHSMWLTVGLVLTLATLLSPWLARMVAWGWTSLAKVLGMIVSRVLLSVVFFVLVTPVALFRQMTGRDTLQLKPPTTGTAFTIRGHRFTPKDLEKPW